MNKLLVILMGLFIFASSGCNNSKTYREVKAEILENPLIDIAYVFDEKMFGGLICNFSGDYVAYICEGNEYDACFGQFSDSVRLLILDQVKLIKENHNCITQNLSLPKLKQDWQMTELRVHDGTTIYTIDCRLSILNDNYNWYFAHEQIRPLIKTLYDHGKNLKPDRVSIADFPETDALLSLRKKLGVY
jgi:hypothetical protein